MTIYNITHKEDIDGMLSYGILKTKYPSIVAIPAAYSTIDQDIDLSKFKKGDIIFVTDFCLNNEDMEYLANICKVIWIDHHISSIKRMEEANIDLYVKKTDTKISACGLVWQFCYPLIPMPVGVEYCTRYDAWTHNWNMDIIYFNFGIYSLPDFGIYNHDIWQKIIESDPQWIQNVIQKGQVALQYTLNNINLFAEKMGTQCQFEGYKCWLMLTSDKVNSVILQDFVNKYNIVITCHFDMISKTWSVELYSNKVDVSTIATKYNGGGHKGAAGFVFNGTFEELLKMFGIK